MPLSALELNRLADDIVATALRIFIHTGTVGANGTTNRVTDGGGLFAAGVLVAPAGWTNAAGGDVENVAAVDYGTASGGDPGTIIFWSAFRGTAFVGSGAVTSTTVNDGIASRSTPARSSSSAARRSNKDDAVILPAPMAGPGQGRSVSDG